MENMIGNAALSMIIGRSCEIYIVFELGLIKRSWYNNETSTNHFLGLCSTNITMQVVMG